MKWNLSTIFRWLLSLGFFALSLKLLLSGAGGGGGMMGAMGALLFGFAALITGVILLCPELAALGGYPISRILCSLYLPDDRERPPVDYTLARLYFKQWRFQEALAQYRHILQYHRHELPAYLEAMEAASACESPRWVRNIYRRGMRRLRDEAARQQLRNALEAAKKKERQLELALHQEFRNRWR